MDVTRSGLQRRWDAVGAAARCRSAQRPTERPPRGHRWERALEAATANISKSNQVKEPDS
jgi:hypothetical protein